MTADEGDLNDKSDSNLHSLYSPFNEKDLEKKVKSRELTMEDF